MRKLLFVGDFLATTGFFQVNKNLLQRLDPAAWDISILAINATGDYHPLQPHYKIYPATVGGGDVFGIQRFAGMVKHVKPDLVVIHQDSWNLAHYANALAQQVAVEGDFPNPPIMGYCPPDSPNQTRARQLNGLFKKILCPTDFGIREMKGGGYTGPIAKLPYGVDTSIFHPLDKAQCRASLGLPIDGWIVGRADRNASRKRYDLTIEYWAEWWVDQGKPQDAWLYLHCAPVDVGWDLPQLASYYGIDDRVIFTHARLLPGALGPEDRLCRIYNSWDLHCSTTLGEGWGLVAHESAACGVAQALPRYSAYAEWMARGAYFSEIEGTSVTTGGINTLGGVPSKRWVKDALRFFYENRQTRVWTERAFEVATQPIYHWDTLAAQFAAHCDEVIRG